MIKNKLNNIIFFVLAIFIFFTSAMIFINNSKDNNGKNIFDEKNQKIFNINTEDTKEINIELNNKNIKLSKENNNWYIENNNENYKAREDIINNLLLKISSANIIDEIDDNETEKYNFNIYLKINNLNDYIYIGKNGVIEYSNYIKYKNKIYLIDQPLFNILNKNINDWREKNILNIDNKNIKEIYINNKIKNISNLDQDSFIINTEDFLEDDKKIKLDKYKINIVLIDGSIINLYVSEISNNKYYIKINDNNEIYKIDEYYINRIIK